MLNFIDYLKNYQKSFIEAPLNEIDSLALSYLSYLNFFYLKVPTKIKDLDLKNNIKEIVGNSSKNTLFIESIYNSDRFKDITIIYPFEEFSKVTETQFASVTFILPNNEIYLAFRGTDSTFVGWEEDFNMAFILPVRAQELAKRYTEKITTRLCKNFYLGGHSKGGNLAVYAASTMNNNLNKYLIKVYSHDGPGFLKEFLTETNYLSIKPKLEKTVPSSSIFGMLLFVNEHYKIIKSNEKGIFQHDPFSWIVEDNHFITLQKLDDGTTYTNNVLNDWISSLSKKEREIFIESLFTVLNSTNLTTLDELSHAWLFKLPVILKTIYNLDDDNKKYIYKIIKLLLIVLIKDLKYLI